VNSGRVDCSCIVFVRFWGRLDLFSIALGRQDMFCIVFGVSIIEHF